MFSHVHERDIDAQMGYNSADNGSVSSKLPHLVLMISGGAARRLVALRWSTTTGLASEWTLAG